MKNGGKKTQEIPIVKKMSKYVWMPLIWWSILAAVLPYIFSLCRISIVWRLGLLFFVINCAIAYHLGCLIVRLKLNYGWILLMPILFCLAILSHFALYNLMFGLIYLIIEVFGLMNKNIYRQKG